MENAGPTMATREAQGLQEEHFHEPGASLLPQLLSILQAHRPGQVNPNGDPVAGTTGSPRGPMVGLGPGQSTCFVTRPPPTTGHLQLCS